MEKPPLLAQIIGTLVVGRIIDRKGPVTPFTFALLLFIARLIAAATASDMYTMIMARAMQGLGAGAKMICVYTAISLSYPDKLRAKILGAFGTAYVLPSMIGPYIAGLIADQWSRRLRPKAVVCACVHNLHINPQAYLAREYG
ncbi:MFS transporter [Paenibacillus filicis]|uniref:MFS transporter n=1 Tax=Paenibacillus filicis TaxID=669464 RepID=A0ABU9DCX7_9BACL